MSPIVVTGRNDTLLLTLIIVLILKSHSFLILPHHHHRCHYATHKAAQSCIQNRCLLLTAERINNNNKNDNKNKNNNSKTNVWNGIFQLWEEVIEMSTYGPSERRMRKKVRRQEANARESQHDDEDEVYDALSLGNFRKALENQASSSFSNSNVVVADDDDINQQNTREFDGYALRDLLVAKWGVALDVDFQRAAAGDSVYCTILPVAFGSRKCQHESELAYLMHLQGVVEVLEKYQNLDLFVDYVVTTKKVPKAGTDSVPFRLELSDKDLNKILNKYK